ncbi:MAG: Methyltransferase type 11, partial [uncultured Solirubrobacteraceae bacterium]
AHRARQAHAREARGEARCIGPRRRGRRRWSAVAAVRGRHLRRGGRDARAVHGAGPGGRRARDQARSAPRRAAPVRRARPLRARADRAGPGPHPSPVERGRPGLPPQPRHARDDPRRRLRGRRRRAGDRPQDPLVRPRGDHRQRAPAV